ncbi:ribokinase [Actinomycetaceae bacterium L2_0104]
MDKAVLVVGSANQDIVVRVPRVPGEGETILGSSLSHLSGGKGLNQACACGATGVTTVFLGAVGRDEAGEQLLQTLKENDVLTSRVQHIEEIPTGTAHILVSDEGGNQIVVVAGANGEVDSGYTKQEMAQLPDTAVVVLQGEIPFDTNREAALFAEERGIRTVFNLAPAAEVSPQLLELADPLVVNEFEAGLVAGVNPPRNAQEATVAAELLAQKCRSVIVTLGAAGSVVMEGGECTYIAADKVEEVVDTTGAGDAFVGVLASELAGGSSLVEAAERASHAAGRTVTRSGAATSYGVIRDLYRA